MISFFRSLCPEEHTQHIKPDTLQVRPVQATNTSTLTAPIQIQPKRNVYKVDRKMNSGGTQDSAAVFLPVKTMAQRIKEEIKRQQDEVARGYID